MLTIVDFLLAFFTTMGILALLWLLFGHMLTPVPAALPLCALIPIEGDAPFLEHTVRQLIWLRNGRLAQFRLILLDRGLSPTGQARVSLLLAQEPSLILTTPDALSQLIERMDSEWKKP